MSIIIDTKGESSLLEKDKLISSDEDDDEDDEDDLCDWELELLSKSSHPKKKKSINRDDIDLSEIHSLVAKLNHEKEEKMNKQKTVKSSPHDFDLDQFETDMGWKNKNKIPSPEARERAFNIRGLINEVNPMEKILEKSSITPGFETLECVPRYDISKKQQKAQSRREREKTTGKKWFNMPKTEMTEEIKHDLEVIRLRSTLDPKRFYKKNDRNVLPKYFQIGKVLDSPADYYNGRMTKQERKKTIVDELMADAEFSKFNKRKYKEIIDEKKKSQYKAQRHAKKLKKRNKK